MNIFIHAASIVAETGKMTKGGKAEKSGKGKGKGASVPENEVRLINGCSFMNADT